MAYCAPADEGASREERESSYQSNRTRVVCKFDGDRWGALLRGLPQLLRQIFVCEVCIALRVLPWQVRIAEMREGSLYVTFHVTHDEDVSAADLEQRIEEYPFREMWRLYNQGEDVPLDGLDAALQRIAALEASLKMAEQEIRHANAEGQSQVREREAQLAALQEKLAASAASREEELLKELAQAQEELSAAQDEAQRASDQNKKLTDTLKREKTRFDRTLQRQSDLIAAIIQENRKEKEAKEREYKEQLDMKDYTIERLQEQLRVSVEDGDMSVATAHTPMPNAGPNTHTLAGVAPGRAAAAAVNNSAWEGMGQMMQRLEEMTSVLQQAQHGESVVRDEVQHLTEALRRSESARQADAVTYENNILALQAQLAAFRDTKLAEDHEKRAQANRARHGHQPASDVKENETIVRQYETSLKNVLGTVQDRLNILHNEHDSYVSAFLHETDSELNILQRHDSESRTVREVLRSASISLQKLSWEMQETDVRALVTELDRVVATGEKSNAAVRVIVGMLDARKASLSEQREWMTSHKKTLLGFLDSLQFLNARAFARQLTMMNNQIADPVRPS